MRSIGSSNVACWPEADMPVGASNVYGKCGAFHLVARILEASMTRSRAPSDCSRFCQATGWYEQGNLSSPELAILTLRRPASAPSVRAGSRLTADQTRWPTARIEGQLWCA